MRLQKKENCILTDCSFWCVLSTGQGGVEVFPGFGAVLPGPGGLPGFGAVFPGSRV